MFSKIFTDCSYNSFVFWFSEYDDFWVFFYKIKLKTMYENISQIFSDFIVSKNNFYVVDILKKSSQ